MAVRSKPLQNLKPVSFINLDRPDVTYPTFGDLRQDTWFRTIAMEEHSDCIFFYGAEGICVCFAPPGVESCQHGDDYDIQEETLVEVLDPKNIQFTF